MKKSRGKLTSEPALYIQGRGEWVRFRRREREKKKRKGWLRAVTHTMVKGLSCRKIAAVNIYSGKLYQGDLRLHVKIFSRNYFPGKHLKDFQCEQDFGFQKTVDTQDKRHNTNGPGWISEISESSEGKWLNPNSNLPYQDEMTLKMSLAIGACFPVFFNVCLHSSSFSLRADRRKSSSSVDGMPQGGGIKISETQLH